jgi:hypothetical protein
MQGLIDTDRVIATTETSATDGRIVWAPAKSLWLLAHMAGGLAALVFFPSLGGLIVFLLLSVVTLLAGHSVGMHRLLIHRSFQAPIWLERLLVWFGTLVGMAGPFGMIRAHDMRDWHQRQTECPPHPSHGAGWLKDAWWQLNCEFRLDRPPRFSVVTFGESWHAFRQLGVEKGQLPHQRLENREGRWRWGRASSTETGGFIAAAARAPGTDMAIRWSRWRGTGRPARHFTRRRKPRRSTSPHRPPRHATGAQAVRHGVDPVAFLHAQLLHAAHHGPPLGAGGDHRQDRVFVDHRRGALGRHLDPLHVGRETRAQIGHRLPAFFALVLIGQVGAHLAQVV